MDSVDVEKRPMTHRSFQEKAQGILQDMMKGTLISSYLLVNTDGFVEVKGGFPEDSNAPDYVHIETIGIMNATMFGAARTMNSELKKNLPQNMMVAYLDGLTYLSSIQDKYYLAVNLDGADQFDDKLKSTILKAVGSISDLV